MHYSEKIGHKEMHIYQYIHNKYTHYICISYMKYIAIK